VFSLSSTISKAVIKEFLNTRIKNRQNDFIHPPYNLEQQLLDAVRFGHEEAAIKTLKKINKLESATLANNTLRSKKNSMIAICTLFTRAIIKGGVYPEVAFNLSDTFIREIENISDLEELKKFEYTMLTQFIRTLKKESDIKNYSRVVNLAIDYIYENILQELTLEIIAQHARVNPSYLSYRFKNEVGVTITEFINKKRIEESKYFLLHTETSISDIALLFRFCNQSYYTALFKKYNGLTPKVFRQIKDFHV
jgi:two-component system, response regulator YesN